MYTPKKIKVLVIDDSLIFRETVARGISNDKSIEVVGTASDPFEARDKIIELKPDVLTLDIEMPKMSGIEFLERLMPQYPLPVVVVSALNDNVFQALDAGAVDFVTKPSGGFKSNIDIFINELIVKIKISSMAKVSVHKNTFVKNQVNTVNYNHKDVIIAIGASTGGTEAILDIIRTFPKEMPGIVIAQHMPEVFTKMYADRLNHYCKMEVKEAKQGDLIHSGKVLIAPGNFHIKLKKKEKTYMVDCVQSEKVNGHRPSVDVLFHSVAEQAGKNAIGVILTGMGGDGAKGLLKMKQNGAFTIGQDSKTCTVYGMPKVAFNIGAVTEQVSLEQISKKIIARLNINI